MHAFGVLDRPKYEISFAEREQMDLLAVVSSQLLLVEHRSGQSLLSCLLKEVDAVFVSFFRLHFRVLDHSGRIKFDVGG
jgi:hypothetical protein